MTQNLFTINDKENDLLNVYLKRLGLVKQAPSLKFLNQLILKHQENIPFENLTRICDFKEQPHKFIDLKGYLERLPSGGGGVCWSLARGFHWLLSQLEFRTNYLYADPGHVCLLVELDQKYYVDIGYGAPFFEAKPLHESFTINASSEKFEYLVQELSAIIVRTPGPTKKLYFKPSSSEEIQKHFVSRNIWGESKFLSSLLVQRFDQGHMIRLKEGVFQDYRSGKCETRELVALEIENVLIDEFEMDPGLYKKAQKYLLISR